MDLLQSFKDFIAKENLFAPGDRLLLAVSGGMDSLVLCELCHQAGFDFIMVHCNFQLRGEESVRDEAFVAELAVRYKRQVLSGRFDTEDYAAQKKISIQVAARELRYNWFHVIIGQRKGETVRRFSPEGDPLPAPAPPRFILTAHHLDDNIETLLMNFFKGTGIAGLRAMLPRQEWVIRPLLFATKAQLHQFAVDQNLSWMEDSSNDSDKYTRNYFRHQVIPLVQEVFPGVTDNLANSLERFREIETIYRQAIEQQKKKLFEYKGEEIHIPVLKLKKAQPLPTLVYEIITEFGFSPQQVPAVTGLLDSPSGKYIRSATHRILKDRNWLIISPNQSTESVHILVEKADDRVRYEEGALRLEYLPASGVPAHVLPPPARPAASDAPAAARRERSAVPPAGRAPQRVKAEPIAWLDAAQIRFPLLLRKWQPGDYFYPLGLRKKKKLARFFIDNKLSLAEKERIWVLEMDKKIIWVVGLRIDDRFRVTPQTTQVLKIESGMA
jgi:tRNA(Ile)-lysidine synthase